MKNPSNKEQYSLYKAILTLGSEKEAKLFFRDLLTEREISELSNRWAAARMLSSRIPYSEIVDKTGLSSTTVARVSRCIKQRNGGYNNIISKMDHHHPDRTSERDLC